MGKGLAFRRTEIKVFYHQPRWFKKSFVRFLMRVKTMTAQAKSHGGILKPLRLNLSANPGTSITTRAINTVIIATPTTILVIGFIKESCKGKAQTGFSTFTFCV